MPDTTDKIKMSYLLWLASGDETRQKNYRAYRDYYDGDHDTQLTDRQRQYLQIKIGREFNINYCPIVVDALAERLLVSGFDAGDYSGVIDDILHSIRIDAVQGVIHKSAIRDGDTYLIIGWDNDTGLPTFTHQLAYDGTEGVKIHYDAAERDKVQFASKRWRIEQGGDAGYINRMNLYYPNRIEKYISDSRDELGYQPYQPPTDSTWPIWWTTTGAESGEP
ncbi:MAG: hypothetical protein KKH61_20060, partial [Gammaproteobacteria bacterium]|nr:hypothetical protein [Gammaproteobacteria bacterium]